LTKHARSKERSRKTNFTGIRCEKIFKKSFLLDGGLDSQSSVQLIVVVINIIIMIMVIIMTYSYVGAVHWAELIRPQRWPG